MTIKKKSVLLLLAVICLFALNLGIIYRGSQIRKGAVDALNDAVLRHTHLASIGQNIKDIQRQVSLLGQMDIQSISKELREGETAWFQNQRHTLLEQIDRLKGDVGSGRVQSLPSLVAQLQKLSESWYIFYENFGVHPARSLLEISLNADPLARRLIQDFIPNLLEEEKLRIEWARAEFYRVDRLMNRITLLIFAGTSLGAIGITFLFIQYLSERMQILKNGAELIGQGNLDHRIDIKGRDELGDLAGTFNRMASSLQQARTDLVVTNRELEAFSASASHDLRAPLRQIDGFGSLLIEHYAESLDERGREYINLIRQGGHQMNAMIENLLDLSRVGHTEMQIEPVDLSVLGHTVISALRREDPGRAVKVEIAGGCVVQGDPLLLSVLMDNLLRNAWKFTRRKADPHIAMGVMGDQGQQVFFVRDNGIGFDMKQADRLFKPFTRLHSQVEYPGTGIGLTTVHRVVTRHGGRIWVEAAINQGTTFYFSLSRVGSGDSMSYKRIQ